MSNLPPPAEPQPTNVRWLIFGLGCSTSWLLYLHRYTFGLIKPELKKEFGWSDLELGLLDSTFSFCYSAFQVPSGMLADILGAHFFLTGSMAAWTLSLVLLAYAPGLAVMRVARGLFGAAQSGCYPTLSRMSRLWFPESARTSMQGWMGVFFGRMGGASANLLFATVLLGYFGLNWRSALLAFASAGLVLVFAFVLLYRDSPRRHPRVNDAEARLIEGEGSDGGATALARPSFRTLAKNTSPAALRNFALLVLQSFLSTFADSIYPNWIPLFLKEVHNLDYGALGLYSMMPLLGGACGGVCGGFLNDRVMRWTGRRRWARAGVGLAGKGSAAVLLASALFVYDSPYLFCGMLFLVKFCGDWSLASTWGTVTDIGGRQTATVFATNNGIASLAEVVAPLLFSIVAATYGWRPVFVIVALIYGLCAATWLLIDCTRPIVAVTLVEEDNQSQST